MTFIRGRGKKRHVAIFSLLKGWGEVGELFPDNERRRSKTFFFKKDGEGRASYSPFEGRGGGKITLPPKFEKEKKDGSLFGGTERRKGKNLFENLGESKGRDLNFRGKENGTASSLI